LNFACRCFGSSSTNVKRCVCDHRPYADLVGYASLSSTEAGLRIRKSVPDLDT
jgi:hypothetical protein